jgi:chitinase
LKNLLKIFIPVLLFLLVDACNKDELQKNPELPSGDYKLIAYVPGWGNIDFSEIQVEKLTHINYAFANIKNGRIHLETEEDSILISQLVELKDKNSFCKVLISIGGAEFSTLFSDVALTVASRELFSASVVDFLVRNKLDGVDIDWEFPGLGGPGNLSRPEDKQNYTYLLYELRKQLDEQSEQESRLKDNPYLLTIASGASQWYLNLVEMNKIIPVLDFLNMMTYDFKGGWSSTTGHHTNLYKSASDNGSRNSAASAVHLFKSKGVPAEKMILGAAFYGRYWQGVKKENHGLYRSYSGSAGALAYKVIKKSYLHNIKFVRYWDAEAKAPYLWSDSKAMFISYDDPTSLKAKATFVRNEELGGMMFWEYTQDDKHTLLDAIYNGLN